MTEPSPAEREAPGVGPWQESTVVEIRPETLVTSTFRLRLGETMAIEPGKHVVHRQTAPDGTAESS